MLISSVLDNDLYKFAMAQAVVQKFPYAHAKYRFFNRGSAVFSEGVAQELQEQVNLMSGLRLLDEEQEWLLENCPYLSPAYIDLLKGYKYNPEEVKIKYVSSKEGFLKPYIGDIEIEIEGPWYRTIYWEVPLMALLSEIYNKINKKPGQEDVDLAKEKAARLCDADCNFADFGTRRRFGGEHHDNIVAKLSEYTPSKLMGYPGFVGSSNVLLAKKHGVKAIGTQAHEWFMFHGATYGYREANHLAMKHWVDVYQGNLGIALTDTFGTDDFFRAFNSKYAKLFDGVRHDSGDPEVFARKTVRHYRGLGINPESKTIVFSDGLNVDKAIELSEVCGDLGIRCSFGIGTNFTNDIVDGMKPLNIVIKMVGCKPYGKQGWLPTVKISDVAGKHVGDEREIDLCKRTLGMGE